MLFVAVRWSLMAQSEHTSRTHVCPLLVQKRTMGTLAIELLGSLSYCLTRTINCLAAFVHVGVRVMKPRQLNFCFCGFVPVGNHDWYALTLR
jgi:hypothetical protein